MKVAVLWFQHRDVWAVGALADGVQAKIAGELFERVVDLAIGARALSHSGFGAGFLGERSIWMSSAVAGGVICLYCMPRKAEGKSIRARGWPERRMSRAIFYLKLEGIAQAELELTLGGSR